MRQLVPGSWLRPGPDLDAEAIRGINQYVEDLFLFFLLALCSSSFKTIYLKKERKKESREGEGRKKEGEAEEEVGKGRKGAKVSPDRGISSLITQAWPRGSSNGRQQSCLAVW